MEKSNVVAARAGGRHDDVDGARAGPHVPVAASRLIDDVGPGAIVALDEGEDLGADVALRRALVDGVAPVLAHQAAPPPGARRQEQQDIHRNVRREVDTHGVHCGSFAKHCGACTILRACVV